MSTMHYILSIFIILVALGLVFKSCQYRTNSLSEKDLYPKNVIPNRIVHDKLTEEQLSSIKKIHETFIEVYPISLEQTIINFKRDEDPNPEINIWLQMAEAYNAFVLKHKNEDQLELREEAFKLILTRSFMPGEEAIRKADLKKLTEDQIKDILLNCDFESVPIKVKSN